MKRTVISMLRDAARKYSETAYVNQKDDNGWLPYTFPMVLEKSRQFASALLEYGFKPDDKISMLAEGRNDWVIAEYGVLFSRCVCVPLSIKLLAEEIHFRVNHSDSKAIIVTRNTFEKAIEIFGKIDADDFKFIYLDEDLIGYEKLMEEKGLIAAKHIIMLNDLYKLGKEKMPDNDAKLNIIEAAIEEEDVVTISYTSGTTGNPKGIMLTHLNYYANSNDAMEFFNVTEGQRLYIILPLDHSFAHTVGIYASLARGLSIFFVDARGGGTTTIKNIPINMKEANPHFLLTVPALSGNFMIKIKEGVEAKGGFIAKLFNAGLNAGIEINKDGYKKAGFGAQLIKGIPHKIASLLIFKKVQKIFGNNIEYCVGGGALLDISQQKFFASIGVPVHQGYGLTEATPIISANTPQIRKMGTSGKVLPTIECKIMDDKGNELPVNKKGEIVIRGENVMKGYYKNEKATDEAIRDGWLWTGDLGFIDEDDFLVVVGREKALLIAPDGEKYSPEGIEEAIMNTSDLINQVMIYNDMKQYTSSVMSLNKEKVQSYVKEHNITHSKDLIKVIGDSLLHFNNTLEYKDIFPDKWHPKTFQLIEDPFTEQNMMINSTLKMVRHKILEVYKDRVDYMYTNGGANATNAKNAEVLNNMFGLNS